MNPKASKDLTFTLPQLSPGCALSFASALAAFFIATQNLAATLALAAGSLFHRSLTPMNAAAAKTLRGVLTFAAYAVAFIPFWKGELTEYYSIPIIAILSLCGLAAINTQSPSGSRGIISSVAITFLLLLRDLVFEFRFTVPLDEIAFALTFVATIEILLSQHPRSDAGHTNSNLLFGLALGLIVSFHNDSLLAAILLSATPVAAFLLARRDSARSSQAFSRKARHENADTPTKPFVIRTRLAAITVLLLPLAFSALFYLGLLNLPFWAENIGRSAPPLLRSYADKAQRIAATADLQNEQITEVAQSLVDPEPLRDLAVNLLQSDTKPERSPIPRQSPTAENDDSPAPERATAFAPQEPPSERSAIERPRSRIRKPTTQPRVVYEPNSSAVPQASAPATASHAQAPADSNGAPATYPPTPSPPDPNAFAAADHSDAIAPPRATLPQTSVPGAQTTLDQYVDGDRAIFDETTAPSSDFERFIDQIEAPESAITRALNLEGAQFDNILSDEPVLIATLQTRNNRTPDVPKLIYLRSNVLDTISNQNLHGSQNDSDRLTVTLDPRTPTEVRDFEQTEQRGTDLKITVADRSSPYLPLPESFAAIAARNLDQIYIFPQPRIALTANSKDSISYTLSDVDLAPRARDIEIRTVSEAYRTRMLAIPLKSSERRYLRSKAKRVGGSASSPERFARRVAAYFKENHPYSFFVAIPPGDGHPVIRWLKNDSPGLCSNYAAAFTLLARSRGIPTRVITGYSSDDFDASTGRYTVRKKDAHAWVEYLDESNRWIRFDPTPGISPAEAAKVAPFRTEASPDTLARLLAVDGSSEPDAPPARDIASALDEQAAPQLPASETPTDDKQAVGERIRSLFETAQATRPTSPRKRQDPSESTAATTPTTKATSEELAPKTNPTDPYSNFDDLSKFEYAKDSDSPTSDTSVASPVGEDKPRTPAWLPALPLLLLLIPAYLYLTKSRRAKRRQPELAQRRKAGRLLAQLEQLMQEHGLEEDPIWQESSRVLHMQRYGRRSDPLLIEDQAVKIALLAKRKPEKQKASLAKETVASET